MHTLSEEIPQVQNSFSNQAGLVRCRPLLWLKTTPYKLQQIVLTMMNLRQNSFIQDVLGNNSKRICCFVANGLFIFMQILFCHGADPLQARLTDWTYVCSKSPTHVKCRRKDLASEQLGLISFRKRFVSKKNYRLNFQHTAVFKGKGRHNNLIHRLVELNWFASWRIWE